MAGLRGVPVDADNDFPPVVRQRQADHLRDPASVEGDALVDAVAAAITDAGGGTPAFTGAYATRPSAGSVPVGSLYFASDVPEMYRSTGGAWLVVGSGGNEVGYAEITANTSVTSGTPVDIVGLVTTFVVGERPVEIRFGCQLKTDTANVPIAVYMMLDGVQKGQGTINGLAADKYFTLERSVRVSGLTPGSTHTAKLQWAGGGLMTIEAMATNPAWISVVTV